MRTIRPSIALVLAVIMTVSPVLAAGDSMGFTTYLFSDSGENSVVTTAFNLAKSILDRTAIFLDIELDHVTVPAITAITGATRPSRNSGEAFEKNRGQIILGIEQQLGDNASFAVNGYRSQEIDYIGNALIGTLSFELFEQNTSMTMRAQYNSDKVGEVLDNGQVFNRPKVGYNGVAGIAQILSPTTVFDLGYDFMYTEGFQSDPYRQVSVRDANGVSVLTNELHPAARLRQAGTARLSQMIPAIEASLIGSYRYYFDDWAVHSHTAELRMNKYIFRNLILGFNYRYYTQTGSYFWTEQYRGEQFLSTAFRTADYKLKPFTSNNVGFSLRFLFRGLADSSPDFEFLRNSGIELTYFRYFNDL
ncbi:MAG: DUF3570 domain-containing protein, partial [Ignavibacteria bacterium]|nr:DUF3570 domain-containing protein [Ignavibacteria bacterium]